MLDRRDVVVEVVKTVSYAVENYLGSIYSALNSRGVAGRRVSLDERDREELQEVLESYLGDQGRYYLNSLRELDYTRLESVCKDIFLRLWEGEEEINECYGGTWIGLAMEDIQFLTGEIQRSITTACDLVMVLDPSLVRRFSVNLVQEIFTDIKRGDI